MKKIVMVMVTMVLMMAAVFAEPVKQDVDDAKAFADYIVAEQKENHFAEKFTVLFPRKDGKIIYQFKGENVEYTGERNVVLTEKGLGSYDIIVVLENGLVYQAKNVSKKNMNKLLNK